jgi:Pirin C-terminal cupin domain
VTPIHTPRDAQRTAQRVWDSDLDRRCPRPMRTRSRASSTIAKEALPVIESEGIRLRLVLGQAYGETVPASVFSDTFYADVQLKPGARIPLPDDHEERELYILEGSVSVAGQSFESGRMMSGRSTGSASRRDRRAHAVHAPRRRATSGGILSPRARRDRGREGARAQSDWGHGLSTLPWETATNLSLIAINRGLMLLTLARTSISSGCW